MHMKLRKVIEEIICEGQFENVSRKMFKYCIQNQPTNLMQYIHKGR